MIFSWNLHKLRKDFMYDNVTYRRMIVTSVLSMMLFILMIFFHVFHTALTMIFASVIVSILLAFCLSVSIYMLNKNKKDYQRYTEYNPVELYSDGIMIKNEFIPYGNIHHIIKSTITGINAYNSAGTIFDRNGEYLTFVIDKGIVTQDHGYVLAYDNNNTSIVKLPLSYIDQSDFSSVLSTNVRKQNIEIVEINGAYQVGEFISRLNR